MAVVILASLKTWGRSRKALTLPSISSQSLDAWLFEMPVLLDLPHTATIRMATPAVVYVFEDACLSQPGPNSSLTWQGCTGQPRHTNKWPHPNHFTPGRTPPSPCPDLICGRDRGAANETGLIIGIDPKMADAAMLPELVAR